MYVRRNVLWKTLRLAEIGLARAVVVRDDGEKLWKARRGAAEGLVNCLGICFKAAEMANGRLSAKAILSCPR